jgi:hypothetical protein
MQGNGYKIWNSAVAIAIGFLNPEGIAGCDSDCDSGPDRKASRLRGQTVVYCWFFQEIARP